MGDIRRRVRACAFTLVALAGGSLEAAASSVPGDGSNGAVTLTDTVRQILWSGDPADLQVRGDVDPTLWNIVSARFVQAGSRLYFFAEIRNDSDEFRAAPGLTIKLLAAESSFGSHNTFSLSRGVAPGGSAFYQDVGIFNDSLVVGDWDTEQFFLFPVLGPPVNLAVYESLRIEGERAHNDGDVPIPPFSVYEVTRDSSGVFVSACEVSNTGAQIPPGRDIRLVELADPESTIACGFADAGELAPDSLGIRGDRTIEYTVQIWG